MTEEKKGKTGDTGEVAPEIVVVDRRRLAPGEGGRAARPPRRSPYPTVVEALQAKAEQAEAGLKKAQEEGVALRRRLTRDFDKRVESARGEVLTGLLDVLDNFDIAIRAAERSDNYEALLEGIGMVRDLFLQRLGDLGIQPVEAEGSEFDPRTCEAIGLMEVEDPGADGKVVETVRRGFLMQGEVLRAAQVRVGRYTDPRSMSAPPDGQAALPDPLPEDARGPLVSGEDGNGPPFPERTESEALPGTAEATGEPERKGDPISPADVDF